MVNFGQGSSYVSSSAIINDVANETASLFASAPIKLNVESLLLPLPTIG